MEKQNVVFSYNGIIFVNKMEWRTVCTTCMNFKNIMLSEKVRHLLYDSISFSLTWGYIFIDPSERGREGERKNIDVRKKHQSAAPHKPHPQSRYVSWPGIEPLGIWKMLQSTEPPSQGCMIPFIRNVQKRQTYRDRKQSCSRQGLRGGERRESM